MEIDAHLVHKSLTGQDIRLLADAYRDAWTPRVRALRAGRAGRAGRRGSTLDTLLWMAGDDPSLLFVLWLQTDRMRLNVTPDWLFDTANRDPYWPWTTQGVPVAGLPSERVRLGRCDRTYVAWIEDPAGGRPAPSSHAYRTGA